MLTIHHFGAETQGSRVLVDQNDQVRVPEKSQFLRGFLRYIRLHPKATSSPMQILNVNIFVFDLAYWNPAFHKVYGNMLKYIWPQLCNRSSK